MIKTLQKKFISTAMIAVTVLLLVVVLAISGIFTYSVFSDVRRSAEMIAQSGGVPEPEDRPPGEGKPRRGWIGEREFTRDDLMSLRFFMVRFNAGGEISRIDTGRISSVDAEEAGEIAREIYQSGRSRGIHDRLYFYVDRSQADSAAVVCMDISSRISSIVSVIAISLCIGAVSWLAMLLLVVALSKRAIVPIAENMERQKQFVTNAGHEIKTPLAIIQANTEALELYTGQSKWTRNILAQTERLSGLMQNLLTLSRMEETDIELPMERFDLGALVEETVSQFKEPAVVRNIEIIVDAGPVTAYANRETIRQLTGILMDNAVKYTPQGGSIRVETASKDGKARLIQSNTISPEERAEDPERLFDRFYRNDQARTQKSGGYGIGLSAALAIAQANKAEISARYEEQYAIVFEVALMI